MHRGTFHHLTDEEADAIVRQYDDKALHLGLNEDWDKNGHKHYLDWFHKEWLGRNAQAGRDADPPAAPNGGLRRDGGNVARRRLVEALE